MTDEERALFEIKGIITSLPAAEQEACNELAEHMRRMLASAGEPVATLALTLVGVEAQLKSV